MILLTIFMSSTDIVRFKSGFDFIGPYRVVLIITFILAIFYVICSKKILKGRYLYLTTLIFISSPIAYIISTNKEWAISSFLNDYMGLILIFLVCNFFKIEDFRLLLKTFILSQLFTIVFSIYSYYMFYYGGGLQEQFNLLGIFNITLDKEFLLRGQISGMIRLSLPYATPPQLSIVMSIIISILIGDNKIFQKKYRYLLIFIFSIILIFTQSRTGVIAMFISIVIITMIKVFVKKRINIKYVLLICSVAVIGVIFILQSESALILKFISRFKIDDILQDRHLLVPLDGILIWISSFRYLFIGIGYGSSINMIGKLTFLPPHFLNSFVTLVAEKGILGLLTVIELINIQVKLLKKTISSNFNSAYVAISYAYLTMLISFIFYEGKQNIGVWVLISISIMIVSNINRSNGGEEIELK